MSRACAPTPRRSGRRSGRRSRWSTTIAARRSARDGRGGHLVIAICAEQGFAGPFNRRVLEVAERALKADGGAPHGASPARRARAGGGGGARASSRLEPADGRPCRRGRRARRPGDRAALPAPRLGRATRVNLVHAAPPLGEIEVVDRALAPFDFARFPRAKSASPPLVTMPPHALLAELAEEYVFAELCEALTLSLAAENEARMRAMSAGQDQRRQNARRAGRPLPPAPAGGDHQRDHRARGRRAETGRQPNL